MILPRKSASAVFTNDILVMVSALLGCTVSGTVTSEPPFPAFVLLFPTMGDARGLDL